MNDDEIRSLLTTVQPSGWIDRTPDTVALLRSRVEEAGADADVVSEWVKAQGGHLDRTQSYRRKGWGPRCGQRESSGEDFYVVPTQALRR